MSKEEEIYDRYGPKGYIKGGELLLQHEDAQRFVEDCMRLGLAILGMDFYIEKNGELVELIGASADYSSLKAAPDIVERSVSAARKLLSAGLPDNAKWVSFIIEPAHD